MTDVWRNPDGVSKAYWWTIGALLFIDRKLKAGPILCRDFATLSWTQSTHPLILSAHQQKSSPSRPSQD